MARNLPRIVMWSSIEISTKDVDGVVSVLLERSKSAPLKISCDHPWAQPQIAITIMHQLYRIQELRLNLPRDDLLQFLRIDAETSAPMLKRLILVADSRDTLTLPRDIMLRNMPSLHHLELVNIIPPKLPASPHLTFLRLSSDPPLLLTSRLLSLLHNSSKLEVVHVDGLNSDSPIDSAILPIRLPNLLLITIASSCIECSAVLTNLEYPPDACVTFRSSGMSNSAALNLSNLTRICRRFAQGNVALTVDEARLYGWGNQFGMTVLSRGNPKLSLELQVQGSHHQSCLTLSMILPFELILALDIEGLPYVVEAGWASLFRRCAAVRDLTLKSVDTSTFRALMKSPFEEVPLPDLQTLRLFNCIFITHLNHAWRFQALKDFLKERKDLGIPIERVVIGTCRITEVDVEELKEFAEVIWDGEEVRTRRNL